MIVLTHTLAQKKKIYHSVKRALKRVPINTLTVAYRASCDRRTVPLRPLMISLLTVGYKMHPQCEGILKISQNVAQLPATVVTHV